MARTSSTQFLEWCWHFGWLDLPPTEDELRRQAEFEEAKWKAFLTGAKAALRSQREKES